MGVVSEWFDDLPHVEVVSPGPVSRTVNVKGEERQFFHQEGFFSRSRLGRRLESEVRIPIDAKSFSEAQTKVYPVGQYVLSGDTVEVNPFSELTLKRYKLLLLPVPEPLARLVEADRAKG